ncbi:MAG: ATPase [Anaerolineae bacterium]|nr:ATPase [Anaerolineae bacterium]
MIVIEINLLLDRLEALLVESRPFLLTSNVIVDRERCFDLINQMRVSIPEEVKKAQRVHRDRDRIIAQANEEAERIIALAHEQATARVSDHEIIRQAEERAQTILERVQREVDEIRAGADSYAREVLEHLEEQLIEQITTVRNGIAKLDSTVQAPAS